MKIIIIINILATREVTKYGFRIQFFMEIEKKIKKKNIVSSSGYSIIILNTKGLGYL